MRMPARRRLKTAGFRPVSGIFVRRHRDAGLPAAACSVCGMKELYSEPGWPGRRGPAFPSHFGYGLAGIGRFNFFNSSSIVVANVSKGLAPFR